MTSPHPRLDARPHPARSGGRTNELFLTHCISINPDEQGDRQSFSATTATKLS